MAAALFGVTTTRLEALSTPQAQVVEQLAHRAALDRVGHGSDAENPAYPDDLPVWLVVFEGEWSITPPMSTPQPPSHACVFAILAAADGHAFHVGTCSCSVCNPSLVKTSLPTVSSSSASSPQALDAVTNTTVALGTQPSTPPATLDATSYASVLSAIVSDLGRQDTSVFENLALNEIIFGLSETGSGMAQLRKDEFMDQLTERISSQTQCIAYTYRQGEISSLTVFISGWEPGWEYKGRANNGLIFFFSDQDEKEGNLRLRSVYLPQSNYIDYVDELYEHRCQE